MATFKKGFKVQVQLKNFFSAVEFHFKFEVLKKVKQDERQAQYENNLKKDVRDQNLKWQRNGRKLSKDLRCFFIR